MKTLAMATKKKTTAKIEDEPSELRMPVWSVVSWNRCEASGLTYVDAEAKMNELNANKISGLCIISDEAAARIAIRD